MKKAILNMKAFYISLFVVLFFPLGLMGQGTEKAELADKEFVYIKDANGWVMCAKDDGTLTARKDLNDGGVLWQVVDDPEDKLYLKNVQHKTFLKYGEANGVYCLVENMLESTPIQVNGGEWYLGTKTMEEPIKAILNYVIESAVCKNWRCWSYEWGNPITYTKEYPINYTLYFRPSYNETAGEWIAIFKLEETQLTTDDFEAAIKETEGITGPTGWRDAIEEGNTNLKDGSISFVNNPLPTKKVGGVNTATKAYKLEQFNFVHRPGETEQKVHEFHEVIYASNKNYPSKNYSYDYSTVKLELPVDGLSNDNSTEIEEMMDKWIRDAGYDPDKEFNILNPLDPEYLNNLAGVIATIIANLPRLETEIETKTYYLEGFYRWYDYSNDITLSEDKGTITTSGFAFGEYFDFPADYITTNNNKGKICLSNQNPGTTTYKIPADFGPDSDPIKIACDVSNYDDYGVNVTPEGVVEITEPTLSYRIIYEIRHADEMRTNLDACKYDSKTKNKKFLETYNVIAPANYSVKIGPEYAWNGSASSYYITSSKMLARITTAKWEKNTDGTISPSYDSDNRLIKITAPEKGISDTYILRNNKDKLAEQRYIAKFVVTGYDPGIVGPLAEERVTEKDPEKRLYKFYPDLTEEEKAKLKFDLKAELDFDDIYDANNPKKMYLDPLPWEDISAGFVYPDLIDIENKHKQREPEFVAMSEYALLSTTVGYTKRGSNLPTITNHGEDLPNGKKGEGYFLYVDATKKPSKVADLSINGDLCPNSKIYVSAWIANASNEDSNYPNLNFSIIGIMKDGTETPISTFTTGDMKTYPGKWHNILFEFETTQVDYVQYRIRIENNNAAYFGVGNDFAIDDIKIYMESRTEATLTQNRSCPIWSKDSPDFNKSNVAILKSNIIDIPSGDVPMYYSWFKKKSENADGSSVEVEHLPLDNYINTTNNTTNGNYGIITVNKEWINIVKEKLDPDGDGNLSFPDDEPARISLSGGKSIDVYASVDDYLRVNEYNNLEKAAGYFFTVEGSGDDALLALHIVHKDPLFQQHEEYTSIVTPMNLPEYIVGFSADGLSDSDKEKRALEALYNELKCGDRSQLTILPYSSIMLKGTSSNYDFDFTQAVVKHLAKGQNYTFAVEAYYEDTEKKDDKYVKVMKPYNCHADWLLVTDDDTKWTDAQAIINWQANRNAPLKLSEGNTLKTSDGSDNSFQVENFSGPLHYIAIPDKNKAFIPDPKKTNVFYTPCAIPVEIYLYDSIPATLADPNVSDAVKDENGNGWKWKYDRPAEICNEPIIVRIPNSLVGKGNFTLNLDIDYFDEYLFAEIAKYNKENEKTQDKNPYPLSEIYLYEKTEQDLYEKAEQEAYKFNITAKDANNQTLTLELLKKNDAVSISGGHTFASGQKYHFAGLNEVNGVKITPPFQFDVYVVPDKVEWTGDEGTAWHNDANWNPAIIPMSHTNVVIPGNTTNKPVLNPSENKFESGAYKWFEHDIVAESKGDNNLLVEAQSEAQSDNLSAVLNSCKDIYFEAGAQLANQHMLNYERAFVDVPFTGTNFGKSNKNFKIMSFPLRNVYRGDLYIPRNYDENTKEDIGDGDFDFPQIGAQFEAMPVNNRAYNSFYVKAYDSAIKQNHVVNNNGKNEVDYSNEYNYENTSWSNPTSVLNFEFEEVHGYAVSLNANTAQSFVRLPKSATEYYLFMNFGNGNEKELHGSTWPEYEIPKLQLKDDKRIRSSEGHKLVYDKSHGASVTFENKKGNIFLIGNPFMTGMSVEKFLAGNTDLDSMVYYTYSDGTISVNVKPNEKDIIPPFGAMFVKGKTNSVEQTFKFTSEMMSYIESTEPSTQQRAPRMVEERELLTITAEVEGARSRTYIEKDFAANNEYLDTEDADLLVLDADLTPISVYSVATGAALAYNSVTDMEFVPLGLLLVDSTIVAESVRFTFDGVDYFYDELYLYDALYNSYLPLIDGVALELEMPESGELRYFITDTKHNVGGGVATSDDLVEGSKVCVFTTEGEACIIAEDIISEATVYDIAGRLIYYSDQISSSQHNISLPNGVYMLKVVVNSNLSTHKIILK